MMATPVVETHALSKSFGETPVLRDVNLKLFAGRAAVLIGGNGAGKSTLLRILGGLSRPSAGRVTVFGEDSLSLSHQSRRRIGMLSHQSWLYPNLTARENIEFYATLYGVPHSQAACDRWLDQVGLLAVADERVRSFSRGMEQRLSLARAMLVEPMLLLLDEPFAALDPDGVAMASGLIRAQVERGCAVAMTAHGALQLDGLELEACSVARGRLVPYGEESRGGRVRSMPGR